MSTNADIERMMRGAARSAPEKCQFSSDGQTGSQPTIASALHEQKSGQVNGLENGHELSRLHDARQHGGQQRPGP